MDWLMIPQRQYYLSPLGIFHKFSTYIFKHSTPTSRNEPVWSKEIFAFAHALEGVGTAPSIVDQAIPLVEVKVSQPETIEFF